MLTTVRRLPEYSLVVAALLAIAFVLRVINLNYNSPFNDEAIYVVIGRLGLFEWDWTSYNTSSWMAGIPFFYPTLAALSYVTGGIVGARLLNIFFGVLTLEAIFMIAFFITNGSFKEKFIAGMVSASLVGGSAVSYYVSRIATYDMPSYYFLFLGIAFLFHLQKDNVNKNKWYFLSFLSLFISFGMKVTTGYFYLPPIIVLSYIMARAGKSKQIKQWKKYFLIPLLICMSLYLASHLSTVGVFFNSQVVARDKADLISVLNVFADNSNYIWIFYTLGTVGLFLKKQWKIWLILTAASLWVLAGHIVAARVPTLDKHTFLSVSFISILVGVGVVYLVKYLPKRKMLRSFVIGNFVGFIVLFWYVSYLKAQEYNHLWTDSSDVLTYLQEHTHSGDKLLTELGSTTILYTYNENHPTNVTTFDWFEYQEASGQDAYLSGVKDGYFDLIVLESQNKPKSENNKSIHQLVIENMGDLYYKSYDKEGFYIYEKQY